MGTKPPQAHFLIQPSSPLETLPPRRCQQKYEGMISGAYPTNIGAVDTQIEPLSYWLPRMLGSMPRMQPDARKEFCDQLVLRQDDAWLALIRSSS